MERRSHNACQFRRGNNNEINMSLALFHTHNPATLVRDRCYRIRLNHERATVDMNGLAVNPLGLGRR